MSVSMCNAYTGNVCSDTVTKSLGFIPYSTEATPLESPIPFTHVGQTWQCTHFKPKYVGNHYLSERIIVCLFAGFVRVCGDDSNNTDERESEIRTYAVF